MHFTYANGVTQRTASTKLNGPDRCSQNSYAPNEPPHGVTFEGSDGWIFVTRGEIKPAIRRC